MVNPHFPPAERLGLALPFVWKCIVPKGFAIWETTGMASAPYWFVPHPSVAH